MDEKTISKIDKLKHHFRDKLKEYTEQNNDWTILRFLTARKHSLKETEKMLSKYYIYLDQIKMR